jgi:hypothetical protein
MAVDQWDIYGYSHNGLLNVYCSETELRCEIIACAAAGTEPGPTKTISPADDVIASTAFIEEMVLVGRGSAPALFVAATMVHSTAGAEAPHKTSGTGRPFYEDHFFGQRCHCRPGIAKIDLHLRATMPYSIIPKQS